MSCQHIKLPPGFRFYPTDEELVVHYLCRRAAALPFPVPVIAEIDLYKFDPWDLPEKALFGEKEWYFFSPRDRKYPNGSRPNRAAGSGYWKATGTDKPIHSAVTGKVAGVKKALVFYKGKAPRGVKTNWIMHEYRLADSATRAAKKKGTLRLDDWVLCRIYKKVYGAQKEAAVKDACESSSCVEDETSPASALVGGPRIHCMHVPTQNHLLNENDIKVANETEIENEEAKAKEKAKASAFYEAQMAMAFELQNAESQGLLLPPMESMPSLGHSADAFLASLAAELL